jgi:hypothetical protein
MTEDPLQITWDTFRKHVPVDEVQRIFPSYSYQRETYNHVGELTIGFHIKDDWAVGFFRSRYRGKRCYYISHSGIEYIFIQETES